MGAALPPRDESATFRTHDVDLKPPPKVAVDHPVNKYAWSRPLWRVGNRHGPQFIVTAHRDYGRDHRRADNEDGEHSKNSADGPSMANAA
jgi:hypothetical protein